MEVNFTMLRHQNDAANSTTHLFTHTLRETPEPEAPPLHEGTWMIVIVAGVVPFVLVVIASMAALLHSVLSLDHTHINVLLESGTRAQQAWARKILPLMKRHHWVTASLVLLHAIADEGLPIVLGQVVGDYVAVALAVPLVLVFGELLPTVMCAGRNQLAWTARMSWLVWLSVAITAPVAYPIGKVMEWWHGHHTGKDYHRGNLKTFLKLHTIAAPNGVDDDIMDFATLYESPDDTQTDAITGNAGNSCVSASSSKRNDMKIPLLSISARDGIYPPSAQGGVPPAPPAPATDEHVDSTAREHHRRHSHVHLDAHTHGIQHRATRLHPTSGASAHHPSTPGITAHEMNILEGTLSLTAHRVGERMIRMHKVFMLSTTTELTPAVLNDIADTAHSRIPVFQDLDRNHIVGVLLVKSLLRVMQPSCPAPPTVGRAMMGKLSSSLPPERTMVYATPRRRADADGAAIIADLPLLLPIVVHPDMTMLDALRIFRSKRSHLALVSRHIGDCQRRLEAGMPMRENEILGIITLEDCLLALLNAEHQLSDAHDMSIIREHRRAGV